MTHTRGFKIVKYVGLAIGILLSYGLTSGWNNSPSEELFKAINTRNIVLARQLITQGADVNRLSFQGIAPLHFAARFGQIPLTQLLLPMSVLHIKAVGPHYI